MCGMLVAAKGIGRVGQGVMVVLCVIGMLELIMQAFCRPPYSTVKWLASRQTRFLHARVSRRRC